MPRRGPAYYTACPFCKQAKGERCVQLPSGKPTKAHAPRYLQAALQGWEPITRSSE
jgi:hypothetical protein